MSCFHALSSKQVLTVPSTFTEHTIANKSTDEWVDRDSPKHEKKKGITFSKQNAALSDDSD